MRLHPLFITLVLVAAPLAAADAGPRDDVKAGAARCDSISDDHTWLNCYYGAAQPVRAELGLSPAPDSQVSLVPPPDQPAPAEKRGFFNRLWPF
jgi:hypothetical protein